MLNYHYFLIEGYEKPFGYVHNHFIDQMEWPQYWVIDHDKRFLTLTSGSDFASRSHLMNQTLHQNHTTQIVPALHHWANEASPLHSPTGEPVLALDSCGVDMLGIINYSVHNDRLGDDSRRRPQDLGPAARAGKDELPGHAR